MKQEVYLTVKELAEVKGCTERYIQSCINKGKIFAEVIVGQVGGNGGTHYRIPLSRLDEKVQLKFKRYSKRLQKEKQKEAEMQKNLEITEEQQEKQSKSIDNLTEVEKESALYWRKMLENWQSFRGREEDKEKADTDFIKIVNLQNKGLNLSRRTLYRKWNLFVMEGEAALADGRGKHGNHSRKMTREILDVFEFYYLNQNKPSIKQCMRETALYFKGQDVEMPSYSTFKRSVDDMPKTVKLYFREREKVFIDKCAPYIKRMYEDLESNDIWVADNHTFDVMVKKEGKPVRVYLTAFMDVRSRKMMGWCVTDAPCSDATIYALKKGCQEFGVPKAIYTDNGREFLFHDLGGNGFRKKRKDGEELKLPSILDDLDIEFRTALPRNARGKGIERAFCTVKEHFSKLFESYTGGTILERPDRLKKLVKQNVLPEIEEFIEFVDIYMPILRGFTGDIRTMPPDIYVNEMPVPQADDFIMPDFVLGFVGEFDRGPVNEYIYCSETPTKRMTEILRPVLGEMSDGSCKGNQLLTHLHMARAKKAVFVRILGAGYETAGLTLLDEEGAPALRVCAKYPGKYANIFTAEVIEKGETFTLKLYSDLDGYETYADLTMDKESQNYAVKVVNEKSYHFILEDLEETEQWKNPCTTEQTQLSGGSNGATLTEKEYIGTFDNGTGKRTGLKLLELAGKQITDFAYIGFSSPAADKALYAFGEKYNSMGYCGTNSLKAGTTGEEIIAYRKTYDTDFCQMVVGNYYANTGAKISGACLSAIVHMTGNIEDSGLATECTWISGSEEEFDFDQLTFLYENQIGCFTLKPSETGQGKLGWRMGNDYTLAIKDVLGEVLTDNENRKVNRRRLNSWIENSLFFVAAKWQGKAMTVKMRRDAEVRIRTFFDQLKQPLNPLDSPKIDDYSITFDESAANIDVFVQNINVKHFNTAEWVLLNFAGGTNAEIE